MTYEITYRPLGEVVEIASGQVDPREHPFSEMPHIGGDNIESHTGRLTGVTTASSLGLISGKYLFDSSYLLYSKIRPILNKVATPDFEGICSADIYPIRPIDGEMDKSYLAHVLRSQQFLSYAAKHSTRTNIPKINRPALLNFSAPVPRLPEQKRIADILDKADAIRQKRQEAIAQFGALTESLFHEMFSHTLPTRQWSDLSNYLEELRYGTSAKSGDGGYVTLRIPNIVRGLIDLGDLKTVEVSESEFDKLRLVTGDVLFVRTNGNPDYVGRCAVFDPSQMEAAGLNADEVIYASYLIRARLKSDRLRPVFLQSLLQTSAGRKNVREKCRTSAGQYNINTKGIGTLQIPDVDIDEQREFESRVASLRPVLALLTKVHTEACDLFNSLVQHAFKGEL